MIIIGEKLNGSIPSCGKAIAARNADYIREFAKKQADAGAAFIDVCASVKDNEVEIMKWMIDLVQGVTDVPISVDSPDPNSCAEAIKFCSRPGIINSVSGEGKKIDVLFPAIADTGWNVIALLSDDTGIPKSAADRLRVFDKIMLKAKEYGISPDRIYIDPLVEMLCASEDGIALVTEVIKTVREKCPDIHVVCAVSNISFNLPVRKMINQAFTVLALNAGMDSAILDPLNKDLMGMIFATEALIGLDEYCMEYISAYRNGIFGPLSK